MSTIGYIGVNSVARKIKTMYIGVDGLARKVKTAYIGVDNSSRKWISGIDTSDPNTRYESKDLGRWSTTSQVDTFLSTYNHSNNYTGLSLGNYVTIQDGTYNKQWEIAGFDCEYNQKAADDTTYNNGYGILMIPRTTITNSKWNNIARSATPYINSTIHASTLVTAATNMRNILGSHMINRNVLLGSEQSGTSPRNWTTSNYTWTTSYLTLMSIGQLTGTFKGSNKFDNGEANYKLPVFNFENYYNGSFFWSRCVYGYRNRDHFAYFINYDDGSYIYNCVDNTYGVRPLMLLR